MRDKGAGLFHKIAQVAPELSSINPSRPSDAPNAIKLNKS